MSQADLQPSPTLLDLHRRAVEASVEVVDLIEDGDWDRPTPCAGWDLRDLVLHMTADNRGFAAAAGGERRNRSAWEVASVEARMPGSYRRSADAVVDAFGSPALATSFWLPRIDESLRFPAARAICFHLLDYALHTWDVGVALGRPVTLAPDLVDAVADIAHRDVPDGPRRHLPGAGFQPAVPTDARASAQDRLLGFLGRSPDWPGGAQ